ncbi:glycosyl hydrolase family 18 protein [Lunatibacter salilacus]|uniref:glycosyl hydrolase family 18 protein n=1 Tax=Lunatibacter salilacus TaxID=2483804 RepID=UPI00131D0E1B|nr:glycosyl hydrolase family 18 protein [Lunatibacter salilacus]
MSRIKLLFLSLILLLQSYSCQDEKPEKQENFRVLGYLFSPENWSSGLAQVDLDHLTSINLAFIHPDESGSFSGSEDLTNAIAQIKAANVEVFFSIGGGSPPPHMENLIRPENRGHFISEIKLFMENNSFDGVDVDLENDLINDHYAPFISDLYEAIRPTGKKMTAALASWNAHKISDQTLSYFDLINVMSYDKTGPWNLSRPGQHAPYEMVVDDFNYFHTERGVPAEKLLIGLPFYGYGFGPGAPGSMTYRRILESYPNDADLDEISFDEGGTLYYNGIGTITQKVDFALSSKAGGIMIWQLLGDAPNDQSLLRTISDRIDKQK